MRPTVAECWLLTGGEPVGWHVRLELGVAFHSVQIVTVAVIKQLLAVLLSGIIVLLLSLIHCGDREGAS